MREKPRLWCSPPLDIYCPSNVNLGALAPYVKSHVEKARRGVALKLERQVNQVVKSSFHKLRTLVNMSFLSFENFERVIHGFINTWVVYFNFKGSAQALCSGAFRVSLNKKRYQ